MSSLTTADLSALATLVDFARGPGYVLDFSDREFSQFFGRELGINIDDPIFATRRTSKGKRLRTFLEQTDNATARRTLEALWSARTALLENMSQSDPVGASDERYQALIGRLGGASNIKARPSPPPTPVTIT